MCSISGILGNDEKNIKRMIRAQRHRAPDQEGFYTDNYISLGMGRLKIIDLSSENLCPRQEDEFILIFNGEIYNYIEIRNKLKKKYKFQTNSDTEVLLKAWKEYGLKIFDHLNGMYAFCIYDKKNKKLYLARDIAGEKPLYYYYDGKNFIFSSEFKAIHKVKTLTKQNNFLYDTLQHCLEKTLFKNVYQLPPASYAIYDLKKGSLKVKEYWGFKYKKIYKKDYLEELDFLLQDSIKIRKRSDVDYGIYLSEGIDSNLLNSINKFRNKFFFNDASNWKNDFYKNIPSITYHLDFPVGSLSSYPLWKLAQKASKKVKVVISGEGADEIFGGYVRYLPISLQWELENRFPSYKNFFKKNYGDYLNIYSRFTTRVNEKNKINRSLVFLEELSKKYFDLFDDPISAVGYSDFKLIMPSLLQMGDRMASSFGIENRCPFLDKRIIEFGFNLPSNLKINGFSQKVILRQLGLKYGMKDPLFVEKKGLTVKFNKWFNRNDYDRTYYLNLLDNLWNKKYT